MRFVEDLSARLNYLLSSRRTRKTLAAALALAALALAIRPVFGDGTPAGEATLVAARDLSPGTLLKQADLKVVHIPAEARPAGASPSTAGVEGRMLAGAARAGEPLTDVRLLSPAHSPPGLSTVPLRLADPAVAELLYPGARIEVITGEPPITVAVTVVTVVTPAGDTGKRPSSRESPLVLVSAPVGGAAALASAALAKGVTVTLRQ